MRLLLDTQVALWWLTASPRLSKSSRELMVSSPCAVSVASIWEVDLKHRLGKLPDRTGALSGRDAVSRSHRAIVNRRTRLDAREGCGVSP